MRKVIYQLILFLYTSNQDDVYALAARNILKNIHEIENCSITDLARLCYVSPATISRLCRKLGFESFSDFKNMIINGGAILHKDSYFPEFHDMVEAKAPYLDILNHQVDSIISTIKNTYNAINFETIIKICEVIHQSNHIIFIGHHTAQFTSIQFQEKLTSLGKDCYGSLNINEQLNLVQNAKEDDVIIIGSISGAFAKSNTNILRYLYHSPATKIAFSNSDELNQNADLFIDTKGNSDSLISKFSLTYLFDLLEMVYTHQYH